MAQCTLEIYFRLDNFIVVSILRLKNVLYFVVSVATAVPSTKRFVLISRYLLKKACFSVGGTVEFSEISLKFVPHFLLVRNARLHQFVLGHQS